MTGLPEPAVRVAHLVGDVQRLGLLSAARVAKRYAEVIDRVIDGDLPRAGPTRAAVPTGPSGPSGPSMADAVDAVDRLSRVVAEALERLVAVALGGADRPLDTVVDRVELPPAVAGQVTEASLWLHNATPSPVEGVELHAGPLVAASGDTIPADVVRLAPARVPVLGADDRREIRVRVTVPKEQRAGHYHGMVVSSATPVGAIAVRIEVLPGAPS